MEEHPTDRKEKGGSKTSRDSKTAKCITTREANRKKR